MELLESPEDAFQFVAERRRDGQTIGLVPTMGALHQGHLSLVEASNRMCDCSVATIFVNPTQFAPNEDLAKYPRTLEADLEKLRSVGTHAVFCPTKEQIYPKGFSTTLKPPSVARLWEGEFRPSHFEGVATIVLKLFNLLPTTHAFFGSKDFQQFRVIEAMVEDLNVPIDVVPCSIVREADGLAMSSRNRYLSETDRQRALGLSRALKSAEGLLLSGEQNANKIRATMRECLLPSSGAGQDFGVDSIDYADIADAKTLERLEHIDRPSVCLIACHVGSTRLIDNLVWDPTSHEVPTGLSAL